MAQFKDRSSVQGSISASSFIGTASNTENIMYNEKNSLDELLNLYSDSSNYGKIFYTEYNGIQLVSKVFTNRSLLNMNFSSGKSINDDITNKELSINGSTKCITSIYDNTTLEFLGSDTLTPLFSYISISKDSVNVVTDCVLTIKDTDNNISKDLNITTDGLSVNDIIVPINDNTNYELKFTDKSSTSNLSYTIFVNDKENELVSTGLDHKNYILKLISSLIYNISIVQPLENGKIEVICNDKSYTEDFSTKNGDNLILRFTIEPGYDPIITIGDTVYDNIDNIPSSIEINSDIQISMKCEPQVSSVTINIPEGIESITIDGNEYTSTTTVELSNDTHNVSITADKGYVITNISGLINENYNVSDLKETYSGSFDLSSEGSIDVIVSKLEVELTIVQTIGGTISVNGNTTNTTIAPGTNFTITITPDEGYSFNYIDINGTKYYAGDTIPDNVLIASYQDITITANFLLMRTVKLNQNNHATLSIQGYTPESDGSYKIPNNTTVTVIATPEDGYEVTGIEKK